MEIGSRVSSIAGVYIGHDQIGRIYHRYLATIIQLYMLMLKKFVAITCFSCHIEF